MFSVEENLAIIGKFKGLRVTDVRDGMDWVGYMHYGSVHHSIRPLYRASAIGIARTARYIPFEGPTPNVTGDEYSKWSGWYYGNVCTYPWANEIQPGDFICLDISGLDVGLLGSNNALDGKRKGAVGYLTNGGGIRDTDEVILEEIPVWSKFISQPMDQGRIRFCEKDIPVGIGGVAIYPGDLVVADGDGVIVVPRKLTGDVAKYAWQEASGDKKSRRSLYMEMGMKLDSTVDVE